MRCIILSIRIRKNTNGDSRVADHVPTINEFDAANESHKNDVINLVTEFCRILKIKTNTHDWTKRTEPYRSMFYRDLCATLEGRLPNFMEGEWAQQHYYQNERHHLAVYAPPDVDLFDVIEMVCDCVAAGMARSGEVHDVEIPGDVLQRAVRNTVEILKEEVEVVDK